MTGEEIVDKLKKAGINASLVHRMHDECTINIDMPFEELEARFMANLMKGSGVGLNMPEPKLLPAPIEPEVLEYCKMDAEATLAFSQKLPLENCVFVDYIKNMRDTDEDIWASFVEKMRKVATEAYGLPPQFISVQKPKDINDGRLRYLEIVNRLRHIPRIKHMDSND